MSYRASVGGANQNIFKHLDWANCNQILYRTLMDGRKENLSILYSHMTNVATMPIYGKNCKISSSQDPIDQRPWNIACSIGYVIPQLFRWWHLVDLDLFHGKDKYWKMLENRFHWKFLKLLPENIYSVIFMSLWIYVNSIENFHLTELSNSINCFIF